MQISTRTKAERLAKIAGGELFETGFEGRYTIQFNDRAERTKGWERLVDHHDDVEVISDVGIAIQL